MITLAYVHRQAPFLGGIERLIVELCAHHDPERVAPKVALLGEGPLAARLPPRVETARFEAPRMRQLGANLLLLAELGRTLRRWKAQAILTNGFASAPWAGALAAALRLPHILYVHEVLGSTPRDLGVRFGLGLPAALILANSRTTHDALAAFVGGRRPVRTIPLGVDVETFAGGGPRAAAVRAALGVPESAPLVIAPGRLQRSKGQGVFLEAAQRLLERFSDAHFAIVGSPSTPEDESFAAELRAGAGPRIHLAPFADDMPALLAAADVVVCPSIAPESFGLVVAEAMAAGRPVVATRAGGLAELVIEGETGFLVAPGEAAPLADAVGALLADPARRRAWGDRAATVAREQHDIRATVRALETAVEEVVHGRR